MILDIGNLLVNLWKTWKEDREFQAWVKMVMSTVYSGVIAFLGTMGAKLVSGSPTAISLGYGMVAAASAILGVMLISPQARSLILKLPTPVVSQYQQDANAGMSTIEEKK